MSSIKITLEDGSTRMVDKEIFDQWVSLDNDVKSNDDYKDELDRMEGSEVFKNVCKGVLNFTIEVGKVVIRIGKIVFDIILKIVRQFPNTILGILVGFILGLIFTSIPILGWLLGSLITPLFMLAGGVMGFMADMSGKIANSELEAKLRSTVLNVFPKAGFAAN